MDSTDTGTEVCELPVGKHSEHVLMQFIPALNSTEELSRRDPVLLGK